MNILKLKQAVLKQVEDVIEKEFGQRINDLNLVFPPNVSFGDFTIECFDLSKQFHQSPIEIAKKISNLIHENNLIERITSIGPYLNIKVRNEKLFGVCYEAISKGDKFGNTFINEGTRVMVEYLSPNTNKPLHLGHLRNGSLGMSISNLFESISCYVIKANLINDRGIHICKSMLAWQKWGKSLTPDSTGIKGDQFVGNWYVRYAKELEKDSNLENEAYLMLKKWESGDEKTISIWKIMNNWVYDGFEQTYNMFGLEFDKFYYESETYKLGKDIVTEAIERKIFSKDDKGSVIFKLPENEFGRNKNGDLKELTILRPDGTSLYITQDIGTAMLKVQDYKLDCSIYVVGSEQVYYFKCLFKILESLGYKWAKGCYHLSYGMVYLPEGKMKSREGKIIDADDLIDEMIELAAGEIRKRNEKLSQREVRKRATKIGVGAIKFYLLSVRPEQDITFDPEKSISFDGATGPYCQYAYARIQGILDNAANKGITLQACDFSLLGNNEELQLIQRIIQFPQEIIYAANEYNPSRIANYAFETARIFNQFYQEHRVISEENVELMKARLRLIKATAVVLKKSLNLLGIEVLDKM
jgi:arginyl-tRNA synthetase